MTTAMDTTIRVAFVGAGQVNFGGGEGPWNHVKRIESIALNQDIPIEVVGICDPMIKQAESVLELRRSNPDQRLKKMWEATRVFSNLIDMLDGTQPHCFYWCASCLSRLYQEAIRH